MSKNSYYVLFFQYTCTEIVYTSFRYTPPFFSRNRITKVVILFMVKLRFPTSSPCLMSTFFFFLIHH